MSVLEKVRRWIDGESAELVLEQAARDAQVKPRSASEEFIVKIARAVEEVMQRELLPLPQGTSIIPSEYIIFLSGQDDKGWQGIKRKGLEQGLYHILAERAKEIAGKKKLETKSFVIELRVDGTLDEGEVRVQHSWEDAAASKTGVLARPNQMGSGISHAAAQKPSFQQTTEPQVRPPVVAVPDQVRLSPNIDGEYQPAIPATVNSARVSGPNAESVEEMTRVAARSAELYRLEIWQGGVRQNVIPIFQNQIVVGRGSKSKPVDISLSGDAEVSRQHITFITDGSGRYWVTNEGRNATIINNYELREGQRVEVAPGTSIGVCSYILRIQQRS
ncbi:MAG: FHA domain-containing protein [Pyrinomonadaceae bacterium]